LANLFSHLVIEGGHFIYSFFWDLNGLGSSCAHFIDEPDKESLAPVYLLGQAYFRERDQHEICRRDRSST
jgi:hypothetical protein